MARVLENSTIGRAKSPDELSIVMISRRASHSPWWAVASIFDVKTSARPTIDLEISCRSPPVFRAPMDAPIKAIARAGHDRVEERLLSKPEAQNEPAVPFTALATMLTGAQESWAGALTTSAALASGRGVSTIPLLLLRRCSLQSQDPPRSVRLNMGATIIRPPLPARPVCCYCFYRR